MSQIVRDATVWWINDPNRTCPVVTAERTTAHVDFINVRFSTDEMTRIREVADEMGLERGSVVRCAFRAWLLVRNTSAAQDASSEVAV